MFTKEQIRKLCEDLFHKAPRSFQVIDLNDNINYDLAFNSLDLGVQVGGAASIAGFPHSNKECVFFGTFLFGANNAGASAQNVIDKFGIYLKTKLVASAQTTAQQNNRAIDTIKFENIFFDSFVLSNPLAGSDATTISNLNFIGYKLVF